MKVVETWSVSILSLSCSYKLTINCNPFPLPITFIKRKHDFSKVNQHLVFKDRIQTLKEGTTRSFSSEFHFRGNLYITDTVSKHDKMQQLTFFIFIMELLTVQQRK